MKNIFLDVAHNFDKMSDSEKTEAKDKIREKVKEITKPRPKTEREKKLDRLLKEELEEYKRKKKEFYDNPIHWTNNKRRRYGLPVLRGEVNKNRSKRYSSHPPTLSSILVKDIIKDTWTHGEFYSCKSDIFGKTYEEYERIKL